MLSFYQSWVYLLVIEEFLILKDVDIQRSNGCLDACDNIEATRKRAVMQKGATWIRPSKNDKEGIQSMIRASIASADEGTRIIPFTCYIASPIPLHLILHQRKGR